MKNIVGKALLAGLVIVTAATQTKSAFGALVQVTMGTQLVKVVPIDQTPSYFFKVGGDGDYVVYTLFRNDTNTGEQNQMLKIGGYEKNAPFDIPGDFDPMFNQDGRTMTIPYENGSNFVCAFYSINDVKANGRSATPLYIDHSMRCVYQSVGLLSDNAEKSTFRLIVENYGGFAFRDYEEIKATNRIHPISRVTPLCPGYDFKLPMISKDGHKLGAYSESKGSSLVFKINDSGTCDVIDNLHQRTGKMSFSYDGKRVVYHVFSTTDPSLVNRFIEVPTTDFTADIYIHDLETGKTKRLTANDASNSIFPEFLKDGRVIYVDHPHDENRRVRFIIVKPNL